MINLIPPEGKRTVVREYWIRIISVWAFLLSGAGIGIALLLIPAYVLINIQLNALQGEMREGNDTEENYTKAETEVEEANAAIDQLSSALPQTNIADVIHAVGGVAGNGIQLRRFEIAREGLAMHTFQLQGTAVTREVLAQFKSALERSPLFESVALPISDLAHDSNLPFAVTITLSRAQR